MEKTIEDANKSLLKKQEANQKGKENVLQSLQSEIDVGRIRDARRIAWKHLIGELQQPIIDMFKKAEEAEKGSFICYQCEEKTIQRFNPIFLTYDHLSMCLECDRKIDNATRTQKAIDRATALESYEAEHDALMEMYVQESGVPYVFRLASRDDLGKATSGALQMNQSYFITGNVGVGKSHMAVALLRMYLSSLEPTYHEQKKQFFLGIENSELPIFIEVPELLLRIRDTYNKDSNESEKDIVEFYTRTPYLVLDDLGSEKASEFSTLMLYLIINRRCTSGKTTIITSNLDLEQIRERLSDRISSRIKGMCREITVAGNDRRYENDVRSSDNASATH